MSRRDTTLEELREELAGVVRRLNKIAAKSDFDPGMDFALKTEIGGIRNESARTKARRWARWDQEATDTTALLRRKGELEAWIAARESHESHAARREEVMAVVTAVMKAMLKPGDEVQAGDYQSVATVTRVNAKTVSFRLPSGLTDRLPFDSIRPLEWERMYAEWMASNGAEARNDAA